MIAKLQNGDLRTAARLLTRIENEDPDLRPILSELYNHSGSANTIGITGPPGSGKSSLVSKLISNYRQNGKTVAVLAVDPSSPFSGGAILGDRVRMSHHDADKGVFIRSMASRGQLGGLTQNTAEAIRVLDVMGWDVILVETVGIGQSEIDIIRHADSIILVQTPESGDGVQAIKAGAMEIADIYAVNKADHEGANAMVRSIKAMLSDHFQPDRWSPPVLETQAVYDKGIDGLIEAIHLHQEYLRTNLEYAKRRKLSRLRHQVLEICKQLVTRKVLSDKNSSTFDEQFEASLERNIDPYKLADLILASNPGPIEKI